jgi:hypothetical protein
MKENDFPLLYRSADDASKKAQKKFLWALGGNLTLLVVAAAMSVANVQTSCFALIQMGPLVGTLLLTLYLAVMRPQRIWYGTRALAESVKTVSWRYVMRAEPFTRDEGTDRDHFKGSLTDIFTTNSNISAHAVTMTSGSQITQEMTRVRNLPLQQRIDLYEVDRVADQQGWYRRKARLNQRASTLWFSGLIVMNVLALGFAAAKVAHPTFNYWPTDILVAAAASVMAWIQTKRFQELAASYTLTAHEIALLRITLPNPPTSDKFSKYVGDAENAFSREHTQWRARRDVD